MPRTATLTTPKKEIFNMTATKAVIYARYSSHNQREESIEGQLRECHEYAEKTIDLIEKELKDTSVLVSLRDKLKDVNRRIKNLMSAIEQGIITETTKERIIDMLVNSVYVYDGEGNNKKSLLHSI